jgi:peroxiredoxin
MHVCFIATIVVAWPGMLAGGWLGWQLLRQNGRLLLRVEELEQRLDELEFAEPSDGHLNEAQGRARHSVRAEAEQRNNGAQGTDAPYPQNRANRFGDRPLAGSTIKRDGLKAGTPAPDFRLPRLDGRGNLSLEELRGRRVLLVFSDPHCGPCNILAPELEKFHRAPLTATDAATGEVGRGTPCAPRGGQASENGAQRTARPALGTTVVMVSRGEPKENRVKVKEHGLTFPVVLQQQWEISRRYAMFATPIAYLIDEKGVIVKDVATGVEPILTLMNNATDQTLERELARC